ncbi:MAG TPA: hypothetical protein VGL77_13440, partial [Armatimonadota bacterium]
IFSDPNIDGGTIFAVADRPQGPYWELTDNLLLGARTTSPVSMRSVLFQGERYALYTDRERVGRTDNGAIAYGTITTPKVLRTDGERLYAAYSPRIESRVTEELIAPSVLPQRVDEQLLTWWSLPTARWTWGTHITGASRTGCGVVAFAPRVESYIYEANITLHAQGAAGLAMRIDGSYSGAAVILDAKEQSISYAELPNFVCFYEKRMTPIPIGEPMHLRVVNRLEHIEIYLNDELRLAFSRYAGLGGRVGLFIDRGHATFSDIRLRTLRVDTPV